MKPKFCTKVFKSQSELDDYLNSIQINGGEAYKRWPENLFEYVDEIMLWFEIDVSGWHYILSGHAKPKIKEE